MDIVDHETLLGWLTRLQLTAIRDQLDSLLDEAAEKKLTLREALAFLVEREVSRKDERRIEMAFKIAHFPAVRELADFDFKAQPSIDERQVRKLATSRWIAHGDAALLLGPPGVGKTHLAIALGREAIRQRYSALFTTAQALMAALVQAHSDDRLDGRSPGRFSTDARGRRATVRGGGLGRSRHLPPAVAAGPRRRVPRRSPSSAAASMS